MRLLKLAIPAIALALPAMANAFDPVAATNDYLNSLSAEARARSDAYFEGGYWLLLWDFLYGAAIAWVLLAGGFAAKLRTLLRRVAPRPVLTVTLFTVAYIVITTVMSFPLDVYKEFFREKSYGLMNQDFVAWLTDHLVEMLVNVIAAVVFFAVLYAVIKAAPRRWWVWGVGVATLSLAVLLMVAPVFINPLFNHFQPMRQGPMRDSILSMARSNGVPADEVYEFDASRQSDRISANVSGFLGTTRISLNDNLLNKATPEAIRAVMGHEMGHYILNHAFKLLIEFTLLMGVGFAFLGWAMPWAVARFGARWGIESVADPAGIPLLVFLFSLFFLVATPVKNSIIRTHEIEADMFGLNLAREPDGFAQAALQLSQYRKMSPGKLEEILFYDHPSGRNRILRSMVWKAENLPAE